MTLPRERMAAFESRIPDRDQVYLNYRSICIATSYHVVIFLRQAIMMRFPTRFNRLAHLNGQEARVIVLSISNDRVTFQSKAIRRAERGFNGAKSGLRASRLEFQRKPGASRPIATFQDKFRPHVDGHETASGNWIEINRLSGSVSSAATLIRIVRDLPRHEKRTSICVGSFVFHVEYSRPVK